MTKSIMLVGVGGQGTILASKLLTIGLTKTCRGKENERRNKGIPGLDCLR